jgi:uncharacterized membrane protein YhaH (DUF805 family)
VSLSRLWFSFDAPVSRRAYLLSGLALAALKYAVDQSILRAFGGTVWMPTDYLRPLTRLWPTPPGGAQVPTAAVLLLALWTLPFIWIGSSMSMRRAMDAGRSGWLALLFLVPGLSWLAILVLCLLPSRASERHPGEQRRQARRRDAAWRAVMAGVLVGLAMSALSVYGMRSYGASLFFLTPFVIGALTAFLFCRRFPTATTWETLGVVTATVAAVCVVLLLAAQEGAVCLAMAIPLAALVSLIGAFIGRQMAVADRGPEAHAVLALAVLPLSSFIEALGPAEVPLREVRSSVIIDAPPPVVWRKVIAFPPLPAPSELVFRLGVAYPIRARLVGEGVGAVRYCEFSTGPFVEPITAWEPEKRLSFDVVRQPPPLIEMSPYAHIAPPHLDGYFRSRRGEFRLIALPHGRTRLEGSTWYELRIGPEAYWTIHADWLVHAIHARVLRSIKKAAEASSS